MLPFRIKISYQNYDHEMRIGSYEGLVELAIAKAFDRDIKTVREAILVSGNIANVALLSKRNSLNAGNN